MERNMAQGVPTNHLGQKCARNLKNEWPSSKSPKTVIENVFPSIDSVFEQDFQLVYIQESAGATSGYDINCGFVNNRFFRMMKAQR